MSNDTPLTSTPYSPDAFDTVYAAEGSSTMRRIFTTVYGDDAAPPDVAAFSFVSRSELERIASGLQLHPDQTLADLGCGAGGPGLWVARRLGATVQGIDISPEAITQATQRAVNFQMSERASYDLGTFVQTGLPDTAFDGAMSTDAIWLAGDIPAALREVVRILRPGGRLVFTTWESQIDIPGFPPQLPDYHPSLVEAGFTVEQYEETPDWERRQRGVYAGILANQAALIQEQGEAAGMMIGEASFATGLVDGVDYLAHARRILVVAQKK